MELYINRSKSLSTSIVAEGVDLSQYKYKFSIDLKEETISFPVELQGDNLKIVIPPLSEKLKNIEPGKYNAYLEFYSLNENFKGFYLRPWQDEIEIKKEPKVSISMKEEKDDSGIKIKNMQENDKPDPPKSKFISEFNEKETKPKKSSRFSKKLVGDE